MKKSILIALAILVGMAAPAIGELPSWLDSVTILPQAPTSSDVVTITLGGTWGDTCYPYDSNLSITGTDIYFDLIHPGGMCLPICCFDWEQTQLVGPLSSGTYTVYAALIESSGGPWDPLPPPAEYLPVAEFTVEGVTTFYVSAADGNDNNDGMTPETAFATIQHGIDTAQDGDTLLVFSGVYIEELDLLGKSITVQSVDEPAVLTASDYYGVSFYHGEDSNSIFKNFIVKDSNAAFLFAAASPTITNVTVADCNFGALADGGADPDIRNCIFWNNSGGDLFGCEARYSRLAEPAGGEGNIDADPLFADANAGDYHLKSEQGRYWPQYDMWVQDEVTSPCIDGGDPNMNPGNEPMPNGGTINMGAYGGTSQASMSKSSIIDPNLWVWYKFDESAPNTVAHDSSGWENHGIVSHDYNDPNWDPDGGRYGGCLVFNSDTAVAVPNGVLNNVNDEITISLWLSDDSFQPDHNNWVLDAGFGDQNSPYRMQVVIDVNAEQIVWRAGSDSCDVLVCDWNDIPIPHPWFPPEWHWFIFVKDEGKDEMSIYAHCTLAAWRGGVEDTLSNLRGVPFKIGGRTYAGNDFIGKMDDFRIYDRAVSEAEVAMVCYLSDPRAFAWNPAPSDGEVNVPPDVNLTWMPGDYALGHKVFFGRTWEEVDNMTDPCAIKSLGDELYDPGPLDLDTTYFWRIDEVNGPNTWKGRVWSFTTANYIVVDDFESYQTEPEMLDCWYDLRSQPWGQATGAWLSLVNSPVHTGSQAMEYWYDTADPYADVSYAEAWRIFEGGCPGPQDWTQQDVKVLTLFFYGDADNDTNETEQMYVGIEDALGVYAEIRYGDYWGGEDMNDLKIEEWQRWDIALQHFSDANYAAVAGDVDLSSIVRFYIGFGDRQNPLAGGHGLVFFDDIRLYPPRCVPEGWMPDLNDDCMVDYQDLRIMALNWLQVGDLPGQFVGDDEINLKDFAEFARHWLENQLWPPN